MNAKLLVIDDDEAVLRSLEKVFRSEGYEVATATNGVEGIDLFETLECDLVLLDLNMPLLDGWETFNQFKRANPKVPIIIITARPDQHDLARSAGAAALIEKPLNLPTLFGTMEHLLRHAKSPPLRFEEASRHQQLRSIS